MENPSQLPTPEVTTVQFPGRVITLQPLKDRFIAYTSTNLLFFIAFWAFEVPVPWRFFLTLNAMGCGALELIILYNYLEKMWDNAKVSMHEA
jgi:hypothetical protein